MKSAHKIAQQPWHQKLLASYHISFWWSDLPSPAKKDDLVLDGEIIGGKGLGLQVMGSIGIDITPGKNARLLLCDGSS
jgi:hypothetical protein